MVSLLRTGRRGVKAAPFSLGNCLNCDLWDLWDLWDWEVV